MREALALQPGTDVSEIGEDHFIPNHRQRPLRLLNRALRPLQRRELASAVLRASDALRPDAVVVYKGAGVRAPLLRRLWRQGVATVNIFPDYSPHAYGRRLEEAIGCYDLVISTKPFHPALWASVYGYSNPCVCVPHGFDPQVHYWQEPPPVATVDVALCSTWRAEYQQLMRAFAAENGIAPLSVSIAGPGWQEHMHELPAHWTYAGPRAGKAYGEFLRAARIAIAPVNRHVVVRGRPQPGDEDTTRTYELASAGCFFLHQRTAYVTSVYDEATEVPLWADARELARQVLRWLPDEPGRRAFALRAHARAVPAYSIPQRAASVLDHIRDLIARKGALRR